MPMHWSAKEVLAAAGLCVASLLAVWALLLPPQGEISQSALFAVAQFLIFAATLLGVDIAVERIQQLLNKKDEKNE